MKINNRRLFYNVTKRTEKLDFFLFVPLQVYSTMVSPGSGLVWYGVVWYGMVWYGMGERMCRVEKRKLLRNRLIFTSPPPPPPPYIIYQQLCMSLFIIYCIVYSISLSLNLALKHCTVEALIVDTLISVVLVELWSRHSYQWPQFQPSCEADIATKALVLVEL